MEDRWYRLDNAGRVFAALASRRTTTVFRVAVTLHDPVDRTVLQQSLDTLMPRFPYYAVQLRQGLFWHYLEQRSGTPAVQTERSAPCRHMTRAGDGPWQFRVLVFDRRISLECSHVLTDGAGALHVLVALLAEYLARKEGIDIPTGDRIMRPHESPHPEEAEDAYRRFYDDRIPPPRWDTKAFRLRGTPLPDDEYRVVTGIVPVKPLRELSHTHGVTLTELLVSVLLSAAAEGAGPVRRPLAVMTPLNLRTLFPSRTMRNFFLSVTAAIDPRLGPYTFDEIVHTVHHSVQGQVSAKSISRQIRRNVGAERNPFLRYIPLLLKIPGKRWLYAHRWAAHFTTVLSNLGPVVLPAALEAHVERFEAVLNPSAEHGIGCGLIGYRDSLYITFGSISTGTGLERAFFTRLRRMGVVSRIETNLE